MRKIIENIKSFAPVASFFLGLVSMIGAGFLYPDLFEGLGVGTNYFGYEQLPRMVSVVLGLGVMIILWFWGLNTFARRIRPKSKIFVRVFWVIIISFLIWAGVKEAGTISGMEASAAMIYLFVLLPSLLVIAITGLFLGLWGKNSPNKEIALAGLLVSAGTILNPLISLGENIPFGIPLAMWRNNIQQEIRLEAANWLIYRSEEYGFILKYPKNWAIQGNLEKDQGYLSFTSEPVAEEIKSITDDLPQGVSGIFIERRLLYPEPEHPEFDKYLYGPHFTPNGTKYFTYSGYYFPYPQEGEAKEWIKLTFYFRLAQSGFRNDILEWQLDVIEEEIKNSFRFP